MSGLDKISGADTIASGESPVSEKIGEVQEKIGNVILTKEDYKRIKCEINGASSFNEVLEIIDTYFDCDDSIKFSIGELQNEANNSNGSRKVLAFAKLIKQSLGHEVISGEYILSLFREHYKDVLDNPDKFTHPNIRELIKSAGDITRVQFHGEFPLTPKKS